MEYITKKTFFRFAFIGGFCALLDLALLYTLTDLFNIWYILSGIVSFLTVSVIGFYLNKKVVFRLHNSASFILYSKFLIIILIGMIINNLFLFIFTDFFGIWYIISRILSSLVALIWNYFGNKKVFSVTSSQTKC